MSNLLMAMAVVVAVVAALRGTWSPCGLSMLSSITPMAERARGNRFAITAAWFILGASVGGMCLGAVSGIAAMAVAAIGLSARAALAIVAASAAAAMLADLKPFGWSLPNHPRQVDETWLNRYRRWVYASGFGWQIGTGVATYVMTAGVYLLVVMASLGGRPVAAVILGTVFGAVRGMTVLLTARATTPQALGALHRRIHDLTSASRSVVVVVQGGVAFTAALASASGEASPASVAIAALAFAVLVAVVGRVRRADRPPSTDRSADTALLSNQ